MRKIISKARTRLHLFRRDERGSESVEFLGTVILLLLVVSSLITILAYVYRVSNLNYACRRIVRAAEVSGEYSQSESSTLLDQLLQNSEDVTLTARKSTGEVMTGTTKIQLRETFTITLTSTYDLTLFGGTTPFTLSIPIGTSVQGMSEVYWKGLT